LNLYFNHCDGAIVVGDGGSSIGSTGNSNNIKYD
jgi:hypothetical protein